MRVDFLNKKGFLSLIELLVSMVIIAVLAYFSFKVYFKKPPVDEATKETLSSQGIDATNYKTIVDSTRSKVNQINQDRSKMQQSMETELNK